MATTVFNSYSQNGEDVVLWRALHGISNGCYIEVGANDPTVYSISRAFYERNWNGITIEPDPHFAQLHRDQRPLDQLIEAAITENDNSTVTLHVVDGTGLSTVDDDLVKLHADSGYDTHDIVVPTRRLDRILEEAGWTGRDIHFMAVDTEGSERAVLETLDLRTWRPWILLIEATVPLSTQPSHASWDSIVTEAGYHFSLFDGLSRWYIAEEHREKLQPALSYGPSVVDNYTTLQSRQYVERVEQIQSALDLALEDVTRWQSEAITRWAAKTADRMQIARLRADLGTLQPKHHILLQDHHELSQLCHRFSEENKALHQELSSLQQSPWWRMSRPLRVAATRVNQTRQRR